MAQTRANGVHGIGERYVELKKLDLVIKLLVKRYAETVTVIIVQGTIQTPLTSVNQGAEFLVEYFHECVSYSMVNRARSALSSVFPVKGSTPFGKHPLIVRLLRDMFK